LSAQRGDYPGAVARDLLLFGLAGGTVLELVWRLEGASFACGCLWVGSNFLLLSWLLEVIAASRRHSRLFIFLLACAKILASYFVLYWLYQVDYLRPVGLTAGLTALPVVLVWRALAMRARGEGGADRSATSPGP
jgi:hypothetical protein